MSLLSTDITKVKRLSLRDVKLPALEVDPITLIQVERPPSEEEIAYCKLVAINPLIEELVDSLDLVSIKTVERIRKVELRGEYKAKEIDKPKLIALAQSLIEVENSYTKEEIIERIKQATNVSQERAEVGFNLMLKAGAVETTLGDRYFLINSTPF